MSVYIYLFILLKGEQKVHKNWSSSCPQAETDQLQEVEFKGAAAARYLIALWAYLKCCVLNKLAHYLRAFMFPLRTWYQRSQSFYLGLGFSFTFSEQEHLEALASQGTDLKSPDIQKLGFIVCDPLKMLSFMSIWQEYTMDKPWPNSSPYLVNFIAIVA